MSRRRGSARRTRREGRRARIAFWIVLAWVVAGGQVLGTAPAWAEAAPPARELTLDDALGAARRANLSLIAERKRLDQAQATLDRAWTVLFPTLAVQGKYTRNNIEFSFPLTDAATGMSRGRLLIQPVNQLDGVVTASMPLLVPAAYPAVQSVNQTARATQENVRATEDTVLFGVAQTFYAAAISDEVLVARQSSVEVARATVANAKTRFEAGAVTKVDVDRAQLALLRGQQDEREAMLAREQTYRALATLIQVREPFKVRVPASAFADMTGIPAAPSLPPTAKTVGDQLSTALRLRPEFRALEASEQAQEAERRSHALQGAPSLSGFGLARAFNYDNFASKSYSWAVGAQLDWQIYDGGVRDTQRRLAAAQQAETAARAEVLRESIRDDLLNGRRQVETKRQAQQTFEDAVELARETIELIRIQYEAGQATQIDLLTAQDNLVSARLAVAQAHFDLAVADLTLRRAAGTFPNP